ncbi:MAG: phosphatase PAP2 family protein [Burkholderiales bacterium]
MKNSLLAFISWLILVPIADPARAGGGPLGIDHKLSYDNSGIWKRSNQLALLDLMIAGEFVGGLWEGGESRLGKTYWQAIDASLLAGLAAQPLKYAFTRARPAQTDDPDAWFQGRGHYSFPSGEVAAVSAIVTPFVLEYGAENPAVYALEALPLYDATARMKVQAHWQTDVLAGFALGTASGYYAHHRDSPFTLSLMPNAVVVGFRKSW